MLTKEKKLESPIYLSSIIVLNVALMGIYLLAILAFSHLLG
ncbi:hypothetical protein ACFVSS_08170 [Peribacillus butanolivorans]